MPRANCLAGIPALHTANATQHPATAAGTSGEWLSTDAIMHVAENSAFSAGWTLRQRDA